MKKWEKDREGVYHSKVAGGWAHLKLIDQRTPPRWHLECRPLAVCECVGRAYGQQLSDERAIEIANKELLERARIKARDARRTVAAIESFIREFDSSSIHGAFVDCDGVTHIVKDGKCNTLPWATFEVEQQDGWVEILTCNQSGEVVDGAVLHQSVEAIEIELRK